MKSLKITSYIAAAAIAGLGGAMALTNPSQPAYEDYAGKRLSEYLKSDVCSKTPQVLQSLLQGGCGELINSIQPQIRQIVANSTQTQNFIFFSIYRTDLVFPSVIPSYQFETIGVFQNFITYTADKK